ncbi:MAG TPA: aminopeptidase P N-terminal domain-containing protein [Casimicrobiaceae bacterium]|nr:aminopeptidase P N-terminal domain-containing protein [Casimicrobiaceae bacterium]
MHHSHQHHRERRSRLIEAMRAQSGGGIAAIPTAPEAIRNADTHYPYRPDSHFYYLSGFAEAEAVVVLLAGGEAGHSRQVLFCRDKNAEREIWDGFRYGPDAAREVFAFDEAYSTTELAAKLADWTADRPAMYTPVGLYPAWDHLVTATLNEVRNRVRTGIAAPEAIVDVRSVVSAMRLVKDEQELKLLRRAAEISSGAHRRAMARAQPGWYEYEVEAELAHEFLRFGAHSPAYPSIVASGPNACVLHYRDNDRELQPNDLLLIDAGCEFQGYASDITRTFPVSGKFSGAQKAIYELVLAAQLACIDAVRPGQPFHDYHQVAERVLARGFVDLKLCEGSLDAVLESGAYKQFYMHRAGHWLGLDVHDVGLYRLDGASRALEPGMVLTVEPGCYIRPADNVPEEFWDIGVRIEDDVLVTAAGSENLTAGTPKSVSEVESACAR